jgi:hypothetical protein
VDNNQTPDELRGVLKNFAPQLVCFSCTVTECLPAGLELIAALKQDSPALTIVAGGRAARGLSDVGRRSSDGLKVRFFQAPGDFLTELKEVGNSDPIRPRT